MENIKKQVLELFEKLIVILEKEKIWWSAEAGTLLGAAREKGFIKWDDDIDVMITYEGYLKLKELYPNNILSTDDKGYPLLFPKWVDNKSDFDKRTGKLVIDLFLLVPTTKQKFKKFSSIRTNLRFSCQVFNRSKFHPFMKSLWFIKILQYFFFWMFKPISIENAYNILVENDPKKIEEHIVMVNPTNKFENKIVVMNSWKVKKMDFENLKINAIINYKKTLNHRYGKDWMIPKKPYYHFEHIDAISVNRKKNKELDKTEFWKE